MDLLLRVAPEVRLSPSASGLRASLAAGSDETPGLVTSGVLVGTGVGSRTGSGGALVDPPSTTEHVSLAQLEQQVRDAHASGDVQALSSVEETLGSLHLDNHPLRRRPEVPESGPIPSKERSALQRTAFRAALPQVSVFKRSARARAKAIAEAEALGFGNALDVAQSVLTQHRAAAVEKSWQDLVDHDPCTVIAELDAHFASAECGCTCVDAGWEADTSRGYVTVVGRYPSLEIVGERGPGASSSGRPMLRRRTRSERNAVYLSELASFTLATARRAISVAVAADDVHVIVVRPTEDGRGLEPIYVGSLSREAVTLRPSLADPVPLLLGSAIRQMKFEGPAHDLVAIDPDTDVMDVVRACTEALADETVGGLLRESVD